MKTAALIVAAGRGTRVGAEKPKQYIPLNGHCALRRSVDLFLSLQEITSVLVVIHLDDYADYNAAMSGTDDPRVLSPVIGGKTRASSVLSGLSALSKEPPDKVLIHDAARPFIPSEVIRSVIVTLDEHDGACAGLPVVDAIWKADDGFADRPVSRDQLWRAQTPQGFRFASILAAHKAHQGNGADDVEVAREAGLSVSFVRGDEDGFKITTKQDLKRALRQTESR